MSRARVDIGLDDEGTHTQAEEHSNTAHTRDEATANEKAYENDTILTQGPASISRIHATERDTVIVKTHDGAGYVLPYVSWQASHHTKVLL